MWFNTKEDLIQEIIDLDGLWLRLHCKCNSLSYETSKQLRLGKKALSCLSRKELLKFKENCLNEIKDMLNKIEKKES